MKIHEYQAKQIFARYGVPVPRGEVAFTVAEVGPIAEKLIAETKIPVTVVKAQIHAGGRGKGGGVKVAKGGPEAATALAEQILGMALVTKQTGPAGQKVRRLYIEQGLDIARELYSRSSSTAIAAASRSWPRPRAGWTSKRSRTRPREDRHHPRRPGDRPRGLPGAPARLRPRRRRQRDAQDLREGPRRALPLLPRRGLLDARDQPPVVTKQNEIVALDAKVTFDDNAEFRHPEWEKLRDVEEEDPVELEAKRAGLSYVSLDGDIGCLVNGAGLAMGTMDIIQHYGGSPANFLDVGGGATQEQVTKAFQMILRSEKVKGIFVNIFGGIMRCDIVAAWSSSPPKELGLKVPLVVRLEGTNVEEGKKILNESGLAIQAAGSMAEGAKLIVAAVSGKAA